MIALKFRIALAAASLAAGVLVASCSSNLSTPGTIPQNNPTPGPSPLSSHIKHVVIIVQENRSFENMFAGWPGANAPLYGYQLIKGKQVKVSLTPMTYAQDQDICHIWKDALTAYNGGKMNGFNLQRGTVVGNPNICIHTTNSIPYHYMDHAEIAPYRTLASQYVLADAMFPTEFGTSFTAHQDLVSGTTRIDATHSLVNTPSNFPWGCDAAPGTYTQLVDTQQNVTSNGPFPCFTQYPTIADSLGTKNVSWRYYVEPPNTPQSGWVWNAFDAIANVRCAKFTKPENCSGYGAEWKNVVSRPTKIFNDVAKGNLAGVTWVIPDLNWSDYPAITSDQGPSWVGDIVNAVGKSQYWNSTAIVVLWDDWGGFYDNAPPPQLDYVGLAIRVPCLIISPYAKHDYVSHTQYEYGSILKFIEQTFGTPSLHSTDERANSLVDSFDFTQQARAFVPIATKYAPSTFINSQPSFKAPDDDF